VGATHNLARSNCDLGWIIPLLQAILCKRYVRAFVGYWSQTLSHRWRKLHSRRLR